ncbi:hypothetical protein FS935_03235 [Metabacillus litoralis]|uniref:Group-specific protein n=1 Tax=Metabacillus litoralis TaxID=152268 RepID=A0A5C6WBK1_9BACI|nr:DUF6123 family protein [Metabacillus litoralis]TXC93222.1 hypothetical protein FS935_03235 [Metabacillus litoralis]
MGKTVDEYVDYLCAKGFILGEDAYGFIQFGKHYTDADDSMVNLAIELTLKIQKEFDGAFFISLLEMFNKELITGRKQALKYLQALHLL